MNRFFLVVFLLLVTVIQACKKTNEQIDAKVNVLQQSLTVDLMPYDPLEPESTPETHLNSVPQCGSIPVEHHNIKISVAAASKEESPNIQTCVVQEDVSYYKWYAILPGTLFKVDVSFYEGIKQVVFKYGSYDGFVVATAYASDGRVIERQKGKLQFNSFVFEKDLEDLKEITLVGIAESFTPVSITLNK